MPEFKLQGGEVTKVGLWHGTVIKMRDGKRYKITKLNPVNVKIIGEDGKTYTYNRESASRHIDEDQSWDGPKEKTDYQKYVEIVEVGATLGTAVELVGRYASKYPGTYVVIAMPNNGTMRLAKLGGEGGRYLRNIEAKDIKIVTV